jgi:hypothetical protein
LLTHAVSPCTDSICTPDMCCRRIKCPSLSSIRTQRGALGERHSNIPSHACAHRADSVKPSVCRRRTIACTQSTQSRRVWRTKWLWWTSTRPELDLDCLSATVPSCSAHSNVLSHCILFHAAQLGHGYDAYHHVYLPRRARSPGFPIRCVRMQSKFIRPGALAAP